MQPELSSRFGVDPTTSWVRAHNRAAQEVMAAYHADRPIRVPVVCNEAPHQHGFYADEVGYDYRRYYADPVEMGRFQLEASRRKRELALYDDVPLGIAPASWPLTVDFHPVPGPGWFGCETMIRSNAVIAHRSLDLSRTDCRELEMPDPRTGGILATMREFWEGMKLAYAGRTFLGQPIGPISHGVATHGTFTIALDLRGAALMEDMYDDPDFVDAFLLKVARYCHVLQQTWAAEAGESVGKIRTTDHGIDMLSAQLYERFIVPVIHQMSKETGLPISTVLHHCGKGAHLVPVIQRHFGLTRLDDLTYPLLDIARIRQVVGPEVWVRVVIEDSIVQGGPPERIRQTVRELMNSGAKGQGRLSIGVGDMLTGTPLEHRYALYEAVKEFGTYPA